MMITETVPDALAGERVDRVVAVVASVTRAEAASLVDDARVSVNGAVETHRSRRLAAGDLLVVDVRSLVTATALRADDSVPVSVVYEDADLVVIDTG